MIRYILFIITLWFLFAVDATATELEFTQVTHQPQTIEDVAEDQLVELVKEHEVHRKYYIFNDPESVRERRLMADLGSVAIPKKPEHYTGY